MSGSQAFDADPVIVHLTGPSAPVLRLPSATADLSTSTSLSVPAADVPPLAAAAYASAALLVNAQQPLCHLPWQLVAGIGFAESGHARSGGSASPGWNGEARPPILGVALDGSGVARVRDSDHGRLDQDRVWDRAVGPLQFLPSTWERFAADGNHDGARDPQNIWDAAAAAASYLCAAASPLSDPGHMIMAVFSYNHSWDYVRTVLTATAQYLHVRPGILGVDGLPTTASSATSVATPTPAAGRPSATPGPTPATTPSPVAATPQATVTPSASPSPSTAVTSETTSETPDAAAPESSPSAGSATATP